MLIFRKRINIHICLIFLLIILISININEFGYSFDFNNNGFFKEKLLEEFIQTFILISTLLIHFKFRKLFIRASNKFAFYLRTILIAFLLYEENSYFTNGLSNFFNEYNGNREINLHNLDILNYGIAIKNIPIPFSELSFNLSYSGIIILTSLLIIGFGSYIKGSEILNFFFFDKKFSFYSLIFFFKLSSSFIFRYYWNLDFELLSYERVELYVYILLLVDTIYKLNSFRKIKRFT